MILQPYNLQYAYCCEAIHSNCFHAFTQGCLGDGDFLDFIHVHTTSTTVHIWTLHICV